MKITELLKNKQQNMRHNKPINIVVLGDSVSQGCFECFINENGEIDTVHDYKSAYSTRLRELLNTLYPRAQINVINSGISGDQAKGGLDRFERDVLAYNPDLVIISYGLNDSTRGPEGLDRYLSALGAMFTQLESAGVETIFLTQNFACDMVSHNLTEEQLIKVAKAEQQIQGNGVLKAYFEAAKELAAAHGVRVCDLYAMWEKMSAAGINTTNLLSNYINHPIREYHYYIAVKLVEEMLS